MAGRALVEIHGVSCSYGAVDVLSGISLTVGEGEFLGVLGPNASGKSSFLRTLARVLRPRVGTVLLDGQDLYGLSPRRVAQRMAVVPQETEVGFDFTVEEVVMLGRIPHRARLQLLGPADVEAAVKAMAATGTTEIKSRSITGLSGGEKQRVAIARALAQEPEVLLLDEPTAHLDIAYQVELLDLLRELNSRTGLTVLLAMHDVNLASQYCRKLLLLRKGRLFACGTPTEVVTSANIARAYGAEVVVTRHPLLDCPHVVPLGRRAGGQAGGRGRRVHVIGGGGMSGGLMEALAFAGCRVSAGVLNRQDSDWRKARALGLEMVEAAPFSPVTAEQKAKNLRLSRECDLVILGDIPFGEGNLANLEVFEEVVALGTPGIMHEEAGSPRDYAGGCADRALDRLRGKGIPVARSVQEILTLATREEARRRRWVT